MASINGISIKNLKQFVGHEGETLFQGNLYLNGKKIGFWSQGDWGAPDRFDFDGGRKQEKELNALVKDLYPEKAIHGISRNGNSFVIDYSLEFLMGDLVKLIHDEKTFKNSVKNGYAGILVVTDGAHRTVWQLPKSYTALSDSDLFSKMAASLRQAMESFFPEDEFNKHEVKVYRSLKDFVVGRPIELKEKSVDFLLKDANEKANAPKDNSSEKDIEI